jgi:SAM-dependent methyltransferase
MDNVREHYDRLAQYEWDRLFQDPYHSLEWRSTIAALDEYLPSSGRLLDAGGGPGRYAAELCRRGYQVFLLDYSEKCVELARQSFAELPAEVAGRLEAAEVGDIRDLSRFSDESFDAALCLGGPLSHIMDRAERERAMSELARVVRRERPVFASVMGYFAVLRTLLCRDPGSLGSSERKALLGKGDHVHHEGGYCDCHFFRPEELRELAEQAGLKTVELRALEGLSSNLSEATNALREEDDGRWEAWLEVLDATCREPSVVATSEHFLYVGRRPPAA